MKNFKIRNTSFLITKRLISSAKYSKSSFYNCNKTLIRAFSSTAPSATSSSIPKISDVKIIDSTLREGEQFATAEFTKNDRIYIAKTLDRLGVDYIELVNPIASTQALLDAQNISRLNLKAKTLVHIRCHMSDAKAAVESGVNGVNMYMATSSMLRQHSHGKGIDAIIEAAKEVIGFLQQHKLEVRFSCEDTFRSDKSDVLKIYSEVNKLGVDRVGLADTVGVATPLEVYDTVKAVRGVISDNVGIEFHTHNDTGCCIANAYMAFLAGASFIDTTVLGIGERNGITPLGGFLGRLYTVDKQAISSKYNLMLLGHLEKYVAKCAGINIPFNNYITGSSAFTHKAGVHSKAVMLNPSSYEVLDPADFGVERHIQFAHRLTGWNAMQARAKQLGLDISPEQLKIATSMIKNLAEERSITLDQIDSVLIDLASGPRISSAQFINWQTAKDSDDNLRDAIKEAADALAKYEKARAAAAVKSIGGAVVDETPSAKVKLTGHLFDKAILNRVVDLLVDQGCEFQVVSLDVPSSSDQVSSAILKLSSKDAKKLSVVKDAMFSMVKSLALVADCSAEEVD